MFREVTGSYSYLHWLHHRAIVRRKDMCLLAKSRFAGMYLQGLKNTWEHEALLAVALAVQALSMHSPSM